MALTLFIYLSYTVSGNWLTSFVCLSPLFISFQCRSAYRSRCRSEYRTRCRSEYRSRYRSEDRSRCRSEYRSRCRSGCRSEYRSGYRSGYRIQGAGIKTSATLCVRTRGSKVREVQDRPRDPGPGNPRGNHNTMSTKSNDQINEIHYSAIKIRTKSGSVWPHKRNATRCLFKIFFVEICSTLTTTFRM